MLNNIANVATDGLCVGCGTCAGVCPTAAIEMHVSNGLFLPKVDENKCLNCGLCSRCCPGYGVDFESLNFFIFGKQPEDTCIGNFLGCYFGYSNDVAVRSNSSSGGVVTQLLSFAFEKGLIDGAVVTRMSANDPLICESFVAKSAAEVFSASKSKYCPTCVNQVLQHVLKENGKFAVVGLPCQIHGIRKAEMFVKALKEKIVLHIGLMCSHTVSYDGTLFLLKKLGLNKYKVAKLYYRGEGWPGSMQIQLKDGRKFSFHFVRNWNAYWNVFAPFFFTPFRCLMCPDHFNELADLSVGDAWLPEFSSKNLGVAIVISRTRFADEILNKMKASSILSLKPLSTCKVKDSQAFSLSFKKKEFSKRLSVLKVLGKNVPTFRTNFVHCDFVSFLYAFLAYLSVYVSSQPRLRSFLVYVPLPLFRVYFGLFKIFFYLT